MNDFRPTEGSNSNGLAWPSWLPWLLLIAAGFFLLRGKFAKPELPAEAAQRRQPVIQPTFVSDNANASRITVAAARPRDIAIPAELGQQEKATISLFQKCSKSTVFIRTQAVHRFSMRQQEGTGTGFVWDKEGRIVTNYHVVKGADRHFVTLYDQSDYPATFLGGDPSNDIALLQIDAPPEKLAPLPIGTSEDLVVGQSVFAIGNPFGLDQTLTTGVISGLGREIQSQSRTRIEGVIQTDAAINPGNSGGPLLDSSARLIGVNTAIYSPSGAYAGVGFAIPVDTVNRVVPLLIQQRYDLENRPWLGISVFPPNDRLALALREAEIEGVLVRSVEQGGTAASVDIRPTIIRGNRIQLGDIITHLDGKPVSSREDLLDFLAEHQIGDRITIHVLRPGLEEDEELKLKAMLKPLVN